MLKDYQTDAVGDVLRNLEAGDRIAYSRLVVIENTFDQEKLEPNVAASGRVG